MTSPAAWLTEPRLRFKLASAWIRISSRYGDDPLPWRVWTAHCWRLGLRDAQLALDCIAAMLPSVHGGHGGVHPALFEEDISPVPMLVERLCGFMWANP